MENSMAVPQKVKDETVMYSSIRNSGYLSKINEISILIRFICIIMLTAAIFTISRIWKQPKCLLIDEYIRKCEIYIYIYMYVCMYIYVCACKRSHFSRVWFFVTQWNVACQAPLSMGFYRQEYWSELPFSSLGDLPDSRIKPAFPVPPVLQMSSLLLSHWGKPAYMYIFSLKKEVNLQQHGWMWKAFC